MRIFAVYLEHQDQVMKVIIPADCEEEAIERCIGNGEVIAAKDVTSSHRFDTVELWKILEQAGYEKKKIQLLDRLLESLGLATE